MTTTGELHPSVQEWPQLHMMSLADLAAHCTIEMNLSYRQEVCHDQYSLEILRRAVVEQDNHARSVLRQQFRGNVLRWMRRHPQRETALCSHSEQEYVDETFTRFWLAISDQEHTFTTLSGVLRYLHLCLNCAMMETLRADSRAREVPLPDSDSPQEKERSHKEELWEAIKRVLPDEKERRVAFLHFHCRLKPSEMVSSCPGEFRDEAEISRLKRNMMDRIVRYAPEHSLDIEERLYSYTEEKPQRP